MKKKLKKMILLLTLTSILCLAMIGCSSSPASNQNPEPASTEGQIPTDEPEDVQNTETPTEKPTATPDTETPTDEPKQITGTSDTENNNGKWHVLDPELAEYLDADFECIVWKLDEGSFYAAEVQNKFLEDGSIVSSSPSSESTLDDSELFQVVYDDTTYFYIRNIYDNGKRHEDTDAGSKDLEEHLDCQLKGYFENDIFYASEIRIIKVH